MEKLEKITVLSDETSVMEGSWIDHEPYLNARSIENVLDWEMKPEGLCKNDVCIPLNNKVQVSDEGLLNVTDVANLVGHPTLVDSTLGIVTIGKSREIRSKALKDRIAPDFTLTDISGVDRSLSDWAGKKRLLVAFSSW